MSDRPQEYRGPLSETPEFRTVWAPPNYPDETQSPVRFVPVYVANHLAGYAWAAVTDDAAGFVNRPTAGDAGANAELRWYDRLRWALANNISPLETLRYWAGKPEQRQVGFVPEGMEQVAASLDVVRSLAEM